jgi:predicted nucleic acid-binding protein
VIFQKNGEKMPDYLFDSGILILHLRNQPGYPELTNRLMEEADVHISAMTRIEIVRGMRERERGVTFNLFDSLQTVPVTSKIADLAGELLRSWRERGMTLGDADAIIAATATHHKLTLVTTNARHFPMPELVVFQADEKGALTPRT